MLMKIDLSHIVVIYDSTSFKDTFVTIRQAFDLNYGILTKRNRKELTVEHFHRFLNKEIRIAMKY